jgi:hypothetical protein
MTSSRKVRWSRKVYTLAGSVTRASSPKARAEERVGHRRDVLVREAHVGAHEERVARGHRGDAHAVGGASVDGVGGDDLLARVIGPRRGVEGRGRHLPRRRALLYSNSPPYSTMSAEMGSSPRVNSARGIASPRAMRGEAEIGAGEQPDVLRVLPVDLLDVLRDDEPDAAFSSEYGAVSRELPQPFERPDTMTEKPPP